MYQSDAPVKVLVAGDQFETVQVLGAHDDSASQPCREAD